MILSSSLQSVPQYAEVPLNIEANRIISFFICCSLRLIRPSVIKGLIKTIDFPSAIGRLFAVTLFKKSWS
jgi:hypothetical protein